MAEVVFVLGAGASAESGAPLMANFLDVAEDLWLAHRVGDDAPHFEQVFRSIAALKAINAQMVLDTYNLESVFSAFEMGGMVGRLGSITDVSQIEATRSAMVRVIARTLRETVRLPVSGRQVRPPSDYDQFAQVVMRLRTERASAASQRGNTVAIITLNYDLGVDYGLHFRQVPTAYCLEEPMEGPTAVPVLKLHGSLNWGTCLACGKALPFRLNEFFSRYSFNMMWNETKEVVLNVADHFPSVTHCTSNLGPNPVVVPPTWNKSDNQLLRNVWRRAAHELSEARYLVFAGYSFPDTDQYFQYLLSLGLAGESRIRRIAVLNPDRAAFDKLNRTLAPALQKRAVHLAATFAEGISQLGGVLELHE